MVKEKILSLLAMEKIFKRVTNLRISEEAKKELAEALTDYGIELARKAATFAEHAKRRTIKASDVRLALKK